MRATMNRRWNSAAILIRLYGGDSPRSVVSARIPNHESLDPTSVGMALLSLGNIAPYSYDPSTGEISMMLDEELEDLKGKQHRAEESLEAKESARRSASRPTLAPSSRRGGRA